MSTNTTKYIYWLEQEESDKVISDLKSVGYKVSAALMTPCEVLKAKDNMLISASPSVWSRVCKRQSSWYRTSDKAGKTMLVSAQPLPLQYTRYLDAQFTESDFIPESLPQRHELEDLINTAAYVERRPDEWENRGIKDSLMFKTLFSITGFWGWGDNMGKHWLNHKANHANFLAQTYTTEIDGQTIPYSVTDNDGVCSSCVEFFNITNSNNRKLVRACPGAVTFGGVKRKVYYDISPTIVKKSENNGNSIAGNAS